MRSKTSYFNMTLYRKNMARFWPIWALYGVIWLFAMPVNILLQSGRYRGEPVALREAVAWFADRTVLELAGDVAVQLTFCFGILVAMAVFSYLYQARSTSMIHALPVRREGLFLTNFLAGYSFFLLPHGGIFLLTLLAEGVGGYVNANALLIWFLSVSFLSFFFYSFAVFCAMFTGHILALPVFYGILNFLVIGVEFLLDSVLVEYVYGYISLQWMNILARWLTPALNLYSLLQVRNDSVFRDGILVEQKFTLLGLQYAMLYAVVGLVLAVVALLVYRRRQLETAGDVVSVAVVRPVFRYGVAFCAALTFGALLYSIFGYLLPDTAWSLLILMLLCGAVGYFVAEMFLQKSFRVFKRWKGCVVFLICLSALMAAMELDLTGFEKRVPQLEGIQSVRVEGIHSAPYDSASQADLELNDPEDIALVVQIHQMIVDHKEEIEAGRYPTTYYDTEYRGEYKSWSGNTLTLSYQMENGSQISRRYFDINVLSEELDQPDSLSALLQELVNRPDAVRQAYGLDQIDPKDTVSAFVEVYNTDKETFEHVEVSGEGNRTRLCQAIQMDLEEGGLGERFLLENRDRAQRTYRNDIELDYLVQDEESGDSYVNSAAITLQTGAEHTIRLLEELGILNENQVLLTWEEWGQLEREQEAPGAESIEVYP